jgi:hypothetical protein
MDARLTPKLGEFCLISSHVLAKVAKIDADGFRFNCENGGWTGRYSYADDSVTIDQNKEKHIATGITCVEQPPADIVRLGYNAIMPWMRIKAGIAREHDQAALEDR